MSDHLETARALASLFRKWAEGAEDEEKQAAHARRAAAIEALLAEVEDARMRLRPISSEYGDLSDLPPAVLAELNLAKIDELEQQLRDIVAAGRGAEVALDPIIIELWRRHKVTHPRRFIMNKLYRMGQKGLILSVEGRKGVYRVSTNANQPAPVNDEFDDDVPF